MVCMVGVKATHELILAAAHPVVVCRSSGNVRRITVP